MMEHSWGSLFLTFWFAILGLIIHLQGGYQLHKENRMTEYGVLKAIILPKGFRKLFFYQDKKNGIFSGALLIEVVGYINFLALLGIGVLLDDFTMFFSVWIISLLPLLFLILSINIIVCFCKKNK